MQNRKEQLRQQRERELRQVALSERNATIGCGDLAAVGGHCEAYIPTLEQRAGLESVGVRVAELFGVSIDQIGPPEATVTCVRDQQERLRPYEEGVASADMVAEVSVEDGTAAIEFGVAQSSPPAMRAGEALAFPMSQRMRVPSTDFRVVLSYRTAPPPLDSCQRVASQ